MNKLKTLLLLCAAVLFFGCTLVVPFSKKKVILMDCENGSLTSTHYYDEKLEKEIIKITAIPDENYVCKSFSVVDALGKTDKISNYTEISENEISFSLEEDNVYVTAIFLQLVPDYPLYNISAVSNDSTLCSLNPSKSKVKEGDTVTFTNYSRSPKMKILDGYPLVHKESGESIEITKDEDNITYSFVMPACNVVIESKVDWIYYPITLKEISGGSIEIKEQAYEGEEVVFVLIPEEGKTVIPNSVVAYMEDIPPVLVKVTCSTEDALEYSFQMPKGEIFISAEFK